MKIKLTAIVILFLLVLCQPLFAGEIEKNIIRLHVIANSDSLEDQRLKLEVRDIVLQEMTELKDFDTIIQVYSYINKNTESLNKVIEKYIANKGFDYSTKLELGKSKFPTRKYNDLLTLPAGDYIALKIIIGQGKGSNWWCVLYPPICHGDWVKKVEKSLVEEGKTVPAINKKIIKENNKKTAHHAKQIWQNFLLLYARVWKII